MYGQLLIGTTWTKTLCLQRNSKVSGLRSQYIATKSLSIHHIIAQQGPYDVTLQIQTDIPWLSSFPISIKSNSNLYIDFEAMLSENTRTELELSQSEQFFGLFIKNIRNGNENKVRLLWERQSQNWSICVKKTWVTENLHDCPKICVKKWRISRQSNRCIVLYLWPNPFWDSKPELFSDIACLRIPYQPCIVLFEKKNPGTPTSNRRELHLHLNVVPTGAGVFKSRHILLHKYVNRIMITYLWRQIQLIIPNRRFRSIECRHFYLF